MPSPEDAAMRLLDFIRAEQMQAGQPAEVGLQLGSPSAGPRIFPPSSYGAPVPLGQLPEYLDFTRLAARGGPLPPLNPQELAPVRQDVAALQNDPLAGMPMSSVDELVGAPLPGKRQLMRRAGEQRNRDMSDITSAEIAMDARRQAMNALLSEVMGKPDAGPAPSPLADVMRAAKAGR